MLQQKLLEIANRQVVGMTEQIAGLKECDWKLGILSLSAALLVYLSIQAVHSLTLHPLAKFPGPKLWAISRLPWVWHVHRGNLHSSIRDLHDRYGRVVRIAPNELSTIEPHVWQNIYVRPQPALRKDPYSQTQPLNGAHSLFTAESEMHARIKSSVTRGLSDGALRQQYPVVEQHADHFIRTLSQSQRNEEIYDMWQCFGDLTLNLISDLVIGTSLYPATHFTSEEIDGFVIHARFSTLMNSLSRWPPVMFLFVFLWFRIGAKLRIQTWKFIVQKIMDRHETGKAPGRCPDIVELVSDKIKEEDGHDGGITYDEFKTNMLSFIFADSLLTTVTLTTTLYFLAKNPHCLKQLKAEIRESFKSSENITVQAAKDLPYLSAVLSESLRLRHPTPIALPRVTRGGCTIEDKQVPAGYVVGTNLHAIQTTPEYWHDARAFRPERFLPADDARFLKVFSADHRELCHPFSTGPRNCVGARLFIMQAHAIMAKLICHFDIELVDKDEPWLDQKAYLIFEPKPLLVKLSAVSD